MLITHDNTKDRFVVQSRYEDRLTIREAGGFRWDPQRKFWWTDNVDGPLNLIDYLDEKSTKNLISSVGKKLDALTASSMADSDFAVPANPNLQYRPFQKAGVGFVAKKKGRTLIADEMGLGKTIQALGYLNLHPEYKRILVVCPSAIKPVWVRESKKWLVEKADVKVLRGRDNTKGDIISENPTREIVIANYDILHFRLSELLRDDWDMIIIDECHKVKNEKAKRTQAFLRIAEPCESVLALTGTPILNRPIELWNIINLIDPDTFSHQKKFKNRYCWDGATRTYNGAQNLDELQEKLRESIMVRRFKSQVLTELPAKQYTVVEVEPSKKLKALDDELMACVDKGLLDELLNTEVLEEEGTNEEKSASFNNIFGEAVPFGKISKFRHEAALAKMSTAVKYVEDLLETEDKVIVFAHHRKVQETLRKKFPNAAYITGGMKESLRDLQEEKFQTDPTCRVFVGSIKAASEGITLTAAAQVVMVEMDWTPAAMQQAEDRAHRIGQEDMVNVHLLVTGGIEGWIAQLVASKEEVITGAVGSNADSLDPRLNELREKVAQLNAHLAVSKDAAKKESERQKRIKERQNDRRKDQWIKFGITEEKMAAAIRMCQMLAGVCDGARAEDGMGFNGCDTRFGKSLASRTQWTARQYETGTKMLRKYKRQVPSDLYEVVYGG